jgi:hypothetical protein
LVAEPEPSQQSLAHMFSSRREDFAHFMQLCKRSPRITIIYYGNEDDIGTTARRYLATNDPRRLSIRRAANDLGIKALRIYDGKWDFILWTDPSSFRGPSKGMLYSTKTMAPLYQSIDRPARDKEDSTETIYARIAPNWYVYYDSNP